jgi:hypothetical protein
MPNFAITSVSRFLSPVTDRFIESSILLECSSTLIIISVKASTYSLRNFGTTDLSMSEFRTTSICEYDFSTVSIRSRNYYMPPRLFSLDGGSLRFFLRSRPGDGLLPCRPLARDDFSSKKPDSMLPLKLGYVSVILTDTYY